MKNTTLLTLTLLAASSAAFAQASNKSGLNYDRVSVGYSSGSDIRSWDFSGTALLGEHVLIGGTYSDLKFKNLGSTTGTGTGFQVGGKFTAGPGDIIVTLGYAQLQAAGLVGSTAVLAAGENTQLGLAWRSKINDSLEYTVSYSRNRVNVVSGGYDLSTGTASANGTSNSENQFGVFLRYNFSKSFDANIGYSHTTGSNIWSLSAGYNF